MEISLSPERIIELTEPVAVRGKTGRTITRIAPLYEAVEGELAFLADRKQQGDLADCRASVVFVPEKCEGSPAPDQLFLYFGDPSAALTRLCSRLEATLRPRPAPGVHATAVIGRDCRVPSSATVGPFCVLEDGATLGDNTVLWSHVFVGAGTSIGPDCRLMPRVTVMDGCRIGARAILHAGTVIGADGFGFDSGAKGHSKVPQIGGVVIGDDVEIGANSTVDRARFSQTVVGDGTKIDNLVQIGHNVRIGRHCLLCAQVGIAGSTTLGDFVILGGQVGLAGHIALGDGVQVAAQSGVPRSLEPGSCVWGSPSVPIRQRHKINVLEQRLPSLFRRVDKIEEELEKAFDNGRKRE